MIPLPLDYCFGLDVTDTRKRTAQVYSLIKAPSHIFVRFMFNVFDTESETLKDNAVLGRIILELKKNRIEFNGLDSTKPIKVMDFYKVMSSENLSEVELVNTISDVENADIEIGAIIREARAQKH